MDVSVTALKPARRRVFVQLDPTAWPRARQSPANRFICAMIVLASLAAILETEPAIALRRIFAALTAVAGIGLIASAFSDVMRKTDSAHDAD